MKLNRAKKCAARIKRELEPYCDRIEIAGSIRRQKPEVGDIEIVCIPKTVKGGLFDDMEDRHPEFIKFINLHEIKLGTPNGKLVRIKLNEGIEVDVFMVTPINWGYLFAIRTGDAGYVKHILIGRLNINGFDCHDGFVHDGVTGDVIPTYEERDVFEMAALEHIPPENRTHEPRIVTW